MTLTTTSTDGSTIAYEKAGSGPALVLVEGPLSYRALEEDDEVDTGFGTKLTDRFTVYTYDRRGRGESTIARPATPGTTEAVEQEVADLAAVIEAAGGHAYVRGEDTGGALALEAARHGVAIDRLVVDGVPFVLDESHRPSDADLPQQFADLIKAGKEKVALERFIRHCGFSWIMAKAFRFSPEYKDILAAVPTLPYDLGLVVPFQQGLPLPAGYYDNVRMPVLARVGGKAKAHEISAHRAIADQVRDGRFVQVTGDGWVDDVAEFFLG